MPGGVPTNMSWEAAEALAYEEMVEHLKAIRRGTADIDDREAAEQLVDQVEGLLRSVGEGTSIDTVNDEYKVKYGALASVLRRLGVEQPNPYRDLWRFYESWRERGLASYASRRAYAAELYEPVRRELEDLEFQSLVDPAAARPAERPRTPPLRAMR